MLTFKTNFVLVMDLGWKYLLTIPSPPEVMLTDIARQALVKAIGNDIVTSVAVSAAV